MCQHYVTCNTFNDKFESVWSTQVQRTYAMQRCIWNPVKHLKRRALMSKRLVEILHRDSGNGLSLNCVNSKL